MYRLTAIAILLFAQFVLAQNTSDQINVFPDKTYRGSFKSVNQATETVRVTSDAIKKDFIIKMKNADGQNHENVVCTGGLLQKCSCGLKNLANLLYRTFFRVEYAEITWNGKKVVDANTFNRNVATLSVSVKPELSNSLVIKYKGLFTSYFSLGIYRPSSPKDTTAPTILTQLRSNTFTNQKSANVEIQDISNVTSTVSINGAVVKSSTAKSFTFDLVNGNNNIEIKSQDQFNNIASPVVISNVVLDQSNPSISLSSSDPVYVNSLPKTLAAQFISNEPLKSLLVNSNQVSLNESGKIGVYNFSILQSGANSVAVQATDLAGNVSNQNLSLSVILDNTSPAISFGIAEGTLTNQSLIVIPIKITEANDVHSIIKVNGVDVLRTGAKEFDFEASLLLEGENQVQVESTDIAGNISQSLILKIIKDSTQPVLSNIQPANNRRIDRLVFSVTGRANEKLDQINVNGLALTLDANRVNFSGTYVAAKNGTEELLFSATDLAGNKTEIRNTIQIDNRLLIPELVSISPSPDRLHLNIIGAAGSVRSEISVSASSGLLGFYSDSTTSTVDGSFILKLPPFSTATLKVKDQQNNEETTLTLSYEIGTRLSGIIKDTDGNPLPGATIRISSYDGSVLSDSSGVFSIASPATGDQTLTVDGSTIAQSVTGPSRKFSTTQIQINIGLGQENVLERPIYLAPLILNGSETTIIAGESATVKNPLAAGVQLDIPANSTVFPGGGSSGSINIASIDANKSTVPVLANVVPDKVIALEPSGLKFQQRVPVTLPNDSDFPAGVEMFILSMDSSKGIWEVDGMAKVSEDGRSIETKPGQGISHFSLIYAAPAKPVLAAVDNPKQAGIDISQGSLSSSFSLPSWKSLGVSIAPSLIYKSNWANPTAYVSNYIDVPRQEYTASYADSGSVSSIEAIKGRYCDTVLGVPVKCYNTYDEYVLSVEYKNTAEVSTWYQPDSIKSQFFIGDLASNIIEYIDNSTPNYENTGSSNIPGSLFAGGFGSNITNYTGIPNRSMISYAVPLKYSTTGEYLPSGVYPSLARYELKIKNLTIRSSTEYEAYSVKFVDDKFREANQSNVILTNKSTTTKSSQVLDQIFPSDVLAPLLVQNKVKSPAGRGWHLGLTQNILNPGGNRVLVEEASGELSTYSVSNTISTIYNSSTTGVDTKSAIDFSQWPKAVALYRNSSKENYFVELDLSSSSPILSTLEKIEQYSGYFTYSPYYTGACSADPSSSSPISDVTYSYKTQNDPTSIIRFQNGAIYAVSQRDHSLYQIQSGVNTYLIENRTAALPTNSAKTVAQIESECLSISGQPCDTRVKRTYSCANPDDTEFPFRSISFYRPQQAITQGIPGSVRGEFTNAFASTLAQADLNNPQGMVVSPDGFLVIADSGNNMVRKVDLTNNQISTIAGDGSNIDQINEDSPLVSGIFHPQSVVYDLNKNLYILTENGYIRKINSQGKISSFAGLPLSQGGVRSDQAPMQQMAFNHPHGMVFDNVNQYLYVADTDNHRVVRIDLKTQMATNVAGGTCIDSEVSDNGPALGTSLCSPKYIGLDSNQNLIIVDSGHNRIRKVNFNFSTTGALAFLPSAKDGSNLYRYNDGSWSRTLRNGTITYFNIDGQEIKTIDRVGNAISYEYNSQKKLTKITDAVNQVTVLNYSGDLLSSITDPAGRTTSFNVSSGKLTSVTFPDSSVKSFEYDDNGLMTKETNQNGFSKKYAYNQFNRLASVTDEQNQVTEVNDVLSSSMSNNYTGGNVGQLNNQGSGASQLHDRVVDAKSIETEITKDFNGLITKIKDGKGQITSIERDIEGYTKKVVFPDLSEVTLEYDPATKDLLKTTDTGTGISKSRLFNSFGQIVSITDGRGFTQTRQYDPSTGLLTQETLPSSQIFKYTYTNSGQLASTTKAPIVGVNNITLFEYDSFGNKSRTIFPDGRSESYLYDNAGNMTQKLLQINASVQEITKYQYDKFNRIVKVISPKNEVTEYKYTQSGQISYIRDPLSNETIFNYNEKGLLTNKVEPGNKIYNFNYDANGNLVFESDPNGVTKTYTIDELNQIVKINLPDDEYNFAYSAKGELTLASNNTATISQSFDTKGRIVYSSTSLAPSVGNYPNVPISYTYDKNGNRETLRSSVIGLDYLYDQTNRLVRIDNSSGDQFAFEYDNSNRLTKIMRPGTITAISYNSDDSLAAIAHSKQGGLIDQNVYSYDQRNLTTQKRTIAGSVDYGYDTNGQLVSANSNTISEIFSYDEIGNRTSDKVGAYTYDSTKQNLLRTLSNAYASDNNGNIIERSSLTGNQNEKYIYNSLNQLKELKMYSGSSLVKTIRYYYDPKGRRVFKSVIDEVDGSKSFSRAYIYDGEKIIAEFDGSGNRLATYTHSEIGNDDILGLEVSNQGKISGLAKNPGKYYYLKDHLGSVDLVTDSSGIVVQKYLYSAFGKIEKILDGGNTAITDAPVVNSSFTFTGRELDYESGLMHYRTRYYSPELGRFIQKDSYAGKTESPVSISNRYTYVENNPIKYKDPSGRIKDPSDFTNVHGAYCGATATGQTLNQYGQIVNVEPEDSLDWACMSHDEAYATKEIAFSSHINYSLGRVAGDLNLFLNGVAFITIKPVDGLLVAGGGALFLSYSSTRAIMIDLPLNFWSSLLQFIGIKVNL